MSSLKFTAPWKGEVLTFKGPFNIFKTSKDKKQMEQFGKNLQNYENICHETCVCKQKPVQIDDFNKAEEKEVKEHVEKRKRKRREVAEKNKLEKNLKKQE